VPRLELEKTIADLMARAQHVLTAQGRLRSLLSATRVVSEDLDLDAVLRRIVRAAIELVGARYGALGVIDEEDCSSASSTRHPSRGRAGDRAPAGHGLLGAVIERARPSGSRGSRTIRDPSASRASSADGRLPGGADPHQGRTFGNPI
jgi:GAF domain-containing protein